MATKFDQDANDKVLAAAAGPYDEDTNTKVLAAVDSPFDWRAPFAAAYARAAAAKKAKTMNPERLPAREERTPDGAPARKPGSGDGVMPWDPAPDAPAPAPAHDHRAGLDAFMAAMNGGPARQPMLSEQAPGGPAPPGPPGSPPGFAPELSDPFAQQVMGATTGPVGLQPQRQPINEETTPGGTAPGVIMHGGRDASGHVTDTAAYGPTGAQPIPQLAPDPQAQRAARGGAPGGGPGGVGGVGGPQSDYMAGTNQVADQEMRDTARQAGEEAAQAQQLGDESLKAETEHQKTIIDQRQMLMKAKAETDQRFAEIQAKSDELMRAEPDPERWWGSRSTGQKIASIIAMTLGGVLQAEHGGPNSGAEIIKQAIDRDMEAQRQGFENRRAGLEMKDKALGQQVQSDQQAFTDMAASEDVRYQSAIAMVKAQVAAAHGAPLILDKAALTIDSLQQARLDKAELNRQQLAKEALDNARLAIQKQQVGIQGFEAGTQRINATTAQDAERHKQENHYGDMGERKYEFDRTIGVKEEAAKAKAAAAADKTIVPGIGGEGEEGFIHAGTEKRADILLKAKDKTEKFLKAEQEFKDLRAQYPGKSIEWISKKVGPAKMRGAATDIMSAYAEMVGITRLTDVDRKLYLASKVGDYNTVFSGAGAAAQDAAIQRATDDFNSDLNTYAPGHGRGYVRFDATRGYWRPASEMADQEEADKQGQLAPVAPDGEFDNDAAASAAALDVGRQYGVDPSFLQADDPMATFKAAMDESDLDPEQEKAAEAQFQEAMNAYQGEVATNQRGGAQAAKSVGKSEFEEKQLKATGGVR